LRHTPAGLPVSEARLQHASEVIEAGVPRQIEMEIAVLALGEQARWLDAAALGSELGIDGFLAQRGMNSRQVVLHVNTIEFIEGNENAQTLRQEEV
jgi:primosomal replication protein N